MVLVDMMDIYILKLFLEDFIFLGVWFRIYFKEFMKMFFIYLVVIIEKGLKENKGDLWSYFIVVLVMYYVKLCNF